MLAVVVVGLLAAIGLGRLGEAVTVSARAAAVADLTALAGAVAGPSVALDVAAANQAQLVSFRRRPDGAGTSAEVQVGIGTVRATAAAVAR